MVLTIAPSSDSARSVRSAVAAATTAASPAGLPSGSGGAAASGAQASKAPPAANSNLLDMVLLLSGIGRGEAEKTIGRAPGGSIPPIPRAIRRDFRRRGQSPFTLCPGLRRQAGQGPS